MSFEQIENITRADIAFRISGRDLSGLFLSGAEALLSVLIENPKSLSFMIERKAAFENSIDLLLYDFLQEIIFYKDSELLLLLPKSIDFSGSDTKTQLNCIFHGERINLRKHKPSIDIKAVTLHNLTVSKSDNGWRGEFVLDV
jgi:SHS2 domain-containing protein